MKIIITLFSFLIYAQSAFTQKLNVDSILQKIAIEKDDDKKVDLVISFYVPKFEGNPNLIIETGNKLLIQSQKNNDLIGLSSANSFMAQGYRLVVSRVKSLEYHHKALELAERKGNQNLLSLVTTMLGHLYKDVEENEKAISFYLLAEQYSIKGTNEKAKIS